MKRTLSFLFLLICISANAADNYKWPDYVPKTIPDSLKNEPAVFLENRITVDFMASYETSVVYFKRIQLLSEKGVTDFTERDLFQFSSGYISLKKARIIKDGKITELTSDNIKETAIEEKLKYGSNYFKRIQFLFPNLQVGDVIDIVYQVDYKSYDLSNTFYLEDELVSLNSRLTLRNMSAFELSIYPTQNMLDYVENSEGEIPTFYWNKTSVPKEEEGLFSAHKPTASKVTYSLWYADKPLNYDFIYESDNEAYKAKIGVNSFTDFLTTKGIIKPTLSPLENINLLINNFNQTFEWDYSTNTAASVKLVDLFDKKNINDDLFFKYIQSYLSENKISFKVGFTKSLQSGPFEHGYVAFSQLEDRFLVIQNTAGDEHYLFAPENKNYYYLLDEIPFYCEGNQSIVLFKNGEDVMMEKRLLPESDLSMNKHTSTVSLKMNLAQSDSVQIKRRDSFSGHYSTLIRKNNNNNFKQLFLQNDSISETEKMEVFPYTLTFKQEFARSGYITKLEDKTYWIKTDSLIPNVLFLEDESKEEMGNYTILPFIKHDKFSIYLESDQAFLLAEKITDLGLNNTVGSIKVEATQVKPTTLKISYEVKLNKRTLSSTEENNLYKDLMIEWNNLVQKKWLISMP